MKGHSDTSDPHQPLYTLCCDMAVLQNEQQNELIVDLFFKDFFFSPFSNVKAGDS